MLLYAGNPVLSTPGGNRLDAAMADLEFCVAIDMYVTETTRHADVILPPVAQLERSDIDLVFPTLSVRNQIRYNRAAVPAPAGGRTDWQILIDLGGAHRPWPHGRADQPRTALCSDRCPHLSEWPTWRWPPVPTDRLRSRRALSVGKIRRAEHGIDLGPLAPNLGRLLRTPGKRVRLAPPVMVKAAAELDDARRRARARPGRWVMT